MRYFKILGKSVGLSTLCFKTSNYSFWNSFNFTYYSQTYSQPSTINLCKYTTREPQYLTYKTKPYHLLS